MQIKSTRIRSYRSWVVDERIVLDVAKERVRKVHLYEKLKSEGCSEKTILEAIGISRATLYRWKSVYYSDGQAALNPKKSIPRQKRKPTWGRDLMQKVLALRKDNPCWGKYKIHKLLVRDYKMDVSVATVGRIISQLLKDGKIPSAAVAAGKNPKKRHYRRFNQHAKRWRYGMKSESLGQLIQIDHMSVTQNSHTIKHFKAVCPISKKMYAQVYSRASSHNARDFLNQLLAFFPFSITSIQVDGGSEFMKEFEAACQDMRIELYVLPPKSPKYNGCVERCNGTTRDEFYAQYNDIFDVTHIQYHLKTHISLYNGYRPHQTLGYLTPDEYIQSLAKEAA